MHCVPRSRSGPGLPLQAVLGEGRALPPSSGGDPFHSQVLQWIFQDACVFIKVATSMASEPLFSQVCKYLHEHQRSLAAF